MRVCHLLGVMLGVANQRYGKRRGAIVCAATSTCSLNSCGQRQGEEHRQRYLNCLFHWINSFI